MTMHIPAKSLTRDYTDPGGAPSAPRQIPNEPMYLMANIAMSDHFAGGQKAVKIDPGDLMIDWIRVYQDPEQINTGCVVVLFSVLLTIMLEVYARSHARLQSF